MKNPEPTILHSFYNSHVETFEVIEETIKQSLRYVLKECLVCAKSMLQNIPSYIELKVSGLEKVYSQSTPWFEFVPKKI